MKILPLTRILFSVATLSVAAALPSQAQMIANALTNGDFETQTTPLTTAGQKGAFSTLTGFQTIGGTVSDSGVEYGTAKPANTGGAGQVAESGNSFVYEKGGDSGLFQITGTTLIAGEQLTLTWYTANSYQSPVQEVGILTAGSTTAAFTAATQVAVANGATNTAYAIPAYTAAPGPYTMFTLTYTATAADVGRNVGIFLENNAAIAANGGGQYFNTDNYDLAIAPAATAAVPEPGTYGLVIMGAVAAFLVIRRRKQALSKSLPV